MKPKMLYEKPQAELLSFHLEDELMSGGATVGVTASGTNPDVGEGVGPRPVNDGLNDKSSYQLD